MAKNHEISVCFSTNAILTLFILDTSVLLENTPQVTFIRNNIRHSSDVFSISSMVKIWMISLISNCLLNCTQIRWCMMKTSSGLPRRVFGSLWKSSEIFGKCVGNVRLAFGTSLENLEKSSEDRQKRRHRYVYIIERTLHVSSKIQFKLLFAAFIHEILFLPLGHKIHTFSPPCNILYICE